MPHTFKTRGTKDSYFQNKGIKGLILPKQGEQRTHTSKQWEQRTHAFKTGGAKCGIFKKQGRGGLNLSWLDMRSRPSRSRSSSKRSRFPKHPSPIDPLTQTWFLSQVCRLVGKVTKTRHPSRRGGDCHNWILSENLASRHFFQNQLTLNIVALLYDFYGMCKCILFIGYHPVL